MQWLLKGEKTRTRPWVWYVMSPVTVAISAILHEALIRSDKFAFIFMFPAVVLVALYGGAGPAALTVLLAIATVFFFIMPPVGALPITSLDNLIGLLVFCATGCLIVILAESHKRSRERAVEAKENLRATEERVNLALKNTPIIVFSQDRDLRYTWLLNPHDDRQVPRLIGKTDKELLPSAEGDVLHEIKARVLGTGNPERREVTATLPDGILVYDLMVQPLRDASGEITGVAGAAVDITNEKMAEAELHKAKRLAERQLAQIEALYQQAPVGMCFLDSDLRYVRINTVLAEWNGASIEDHIGRRPGEVLPQLADTVEPLLESLMLSKQPLRDLEAEMIDASTGLLRRFNASFDPVLSETGELQGISAVIQDVTERARAESAASLLAEATKTLAASLDYETTLDQLAKAMVPSFGDWCAVDILNEDGTLDRASVQHVNPERINWAREIQEKYPPNMDAPTGTPAVIRTGKSELYEFIPEEMLRAAARDDEHWKYIEQIGFNSAMVVPLVARGQVFGTMTLVFAETKKRYGKADLELAEELGRRAGTAIDNARLYRSAQREIEERIKAEAQVLNLVRELEQRVEQRTGALRAAVEDLEGFCYSVSHDLRAPMRSLSANSRILLEDFGKETTPEARKHLERMASAATKMGELIDDLLQFSRLGRAELAVKDIDLSALAEQVATQCMTHHPEWTGRVAVEPGIRVKGDHMMLSLALQNLLENSIKYSSKVQDPVVQVGAGHSNGSAVIFVKDNGIGFDPQYAHKIYQPFERLHRDEEYPGTGIGLANTKRIILRHGGKLWAESEPGRGATFYFTLGNPADMPQTIASDVVTEGASFLG